MYLKKYISGNYDPFVLNEVIFKVDGYRLQIKEKKWHSLWIFSLWRIIYVIIREFIKIVIHTPVISYFSNVWDCFDKNVLFILTTNNNLNSLKEVMNCLVNGKKDFFLIDKNNKYRCIPYIQILLASLLYIPILLMRIRLLNKEERVLVNWYMHYFLFSPGTVWMYYRIFSKYQPEIVVFANDHIYDKKAMIYVCEELGIKTMYVQHASAYDGLPRLHFSYSFLDGLDSLLKYVPSNEYKYGDIFLIGAIRYDLLNNYRTKRSQSFRMCVGVALNELDDEDKIVRMCSCIVEKFPNVQLKIRTHPSMKQMKLLSDMSDRVICNSANEEPILVFFNDIDILFAGASGIHLDAILSGVPSYAFNFLSTSYPDGYSYVSKGLVELLNTEKEVVNVIDTMYQQGSFFVPDPLVVRDFDESYKKSYAGSCHQIVADFILGGYDVGNFIKKYKMEKKVLRNADGAQYNIIPD